MGVCIQLYIKMTRIRTPVNVYILPTIYLFNLLQQVPVSPFGFHYTEGKQYVISDTVI